MCAGAVQHSLQHDGSDFIPVYCVCPHRSLHGSLLPAPSGFLPTSVCGFVCWQVCTQKIIIIIVKRSPQKLVDAGKPTVNFGWVMTKRSPCNVAGSLKFQVWNLTRASWKSFRTDLMLRSQPLITENHETGFSCNKHLKTRGEEKEVTASL